MKHKKHTKLLSTLWNPDNLRKQIYAIDKPYIQAKSLLQSGLSASIIATMDGVGAALSQDGMTAAVAAEIGGQVPSIQCADDVVKQPASCAWIYA